ncbi:hypothetical protein SAMN05216266_111188 [Amycolatopsis marina]|uniref:Uncharacterized protein n=1 Tax=Amycolatopsis marina TaxID=490629 RepID=A0A1I1B1T0_9PSEU|nr:hypothetical protein [Amycolatopsis marina]SFB44295.1 hypothetical protein SAMN05216266_111188 [Amycolatopsis marina]
MSTNVADDRQSSTRRHTVAELLARERAEVATGARPDTDEIPRATLPVVELLRREGIEFAGDSAPTDRFEAVAPAVPVALRKDPGKQRERKGALGRTSTMSRAVVLFGLTVAGLVALKPTVASSPVDDAPQHDSDRTMAAPRGAQPGPGTDIARTGGGTTPTTTAASVLLNDTADVASPMRRPSSAAAVDRGGSGGATQAESDDGATVSTAAPKPTTSNTPPAPRTGSTTTESKPPPRNDSGGTDTGGEQTQDGGLLDPVLDPVTGTVKGVLDLGGGLLGG